MEVVGNTYNVVANAGLILIPCVIAYLAVRARLPWTGERPSSRGFPVAVPSAKPLNVGRLAGTSDASFKPAWSPRTNPVRSEDFEACPVVVVTAFECFIRGKLFKSLIGLRTEQELRSVLDGWLAAAVHRR